MAFDGRDPGLLSDVHEGAVSDIAVEPVTVARLGRDVEVQVSIAVVVEYGHPRTVIPDIEVAAEVRRRNVRKRRDRRAEFQGVDELARTERRGVDRTLSLNRQVGNGHRFGFAAALGGNHRCPDAKVGARSQCSDSKDRHPDRDPQSPRGASEPCYRPARHQSGQPPEGHGPPGRGGKQQCRGWSDPHSEQQEQHDQRDLEQQRDVDQDAQRGRNGNARDVVAEVRFDRIGTEPLDRQPAGESGD